MYLSMMGRRKQHSGAVPMDKLLETRGRDYGDAWKLTGLVIQPVAEEVVDLAVKTPEVWLPWVQILNKLVRILVTPKNADHWRDIVGYATLVLESLTEKEDK